MEYNMQRFEYADYSTQELLEYYGLPKIFIKSKW